MDQTNKQIIKLILKLEDFLAGNNSLNSANEIFSVFIELFYDDDEIFNVAQALAEYRPEGGEYLYDKETIKPTCQYLIQLIRKKIYN